MVPLSSSIADTTPQANPQPTQQGGMVEDSKDTVEFKPEMLKIFQDPDTAYYIEKYNKYEVDYVRRLKAKYFSKKALNGGDIFEKETTIDNEVIKSSKWPCTRSFTDSVQSFEDQSRPSVSAAETSTTMSNKKYQCKKSS